MKLAIILAIIASLIDTAGSVLYIKDVLAGRCRPSITSWGLWSFLAILSCCSYTVMTGDWIKGIIPIASTVACVGTFVCALFKGNLDKLRKLDYWVLTIGIIAALVWWTFKNATYGNILLQPCFIIGYIPTYKNIWKDSKSEKPLPLASVDGNVHNADNGCPFAVEGAIPRSCARNRPYYLRHRSHFDA